MADLLVTTTGVKRSDNNSGIRTRKAGATIAAGDSVYEDVNGKWQLADANGVSAAMAQVAGIAVGGGALDQEVTVITGGKLTLPTSGVGTTMVKGSVYVLSSNPGKIAPAADLVAGHNVTVLGVALSATELLVSIVVSGIAV